MLDERAPDYGHMFRYIPAKPGVAVLAGLVFFTGFGELLSWIVFQYRRETVIEPTPVAYRGHLSCKGMQDNSLLWRTTAEILLSSLCGFFGLFGALDHCYAKLSWFFYYLVFLCLFRFVIFVWDTVFLMECKAYPTNTIGLTVLWPVYNLPILERRKEHILSQSTFPYWSINSYVGANLFIGYAIFTIVFCALCFYVAKVTRRLMFLYREGEAGLGEFIPMRLGDIGFVEKQKQLGKKMRDGTKEFFEDHPLLKPVNFSDKFSFGFNNTIFV